MAFLNPREWRTVVSTLAQKLDFRNIDYTLMDGAAVNFLNLNHPRLTEDIDLVIHVDNRQITADCLTTLLLHSFPADFEGANQYGHAIPAYKLQRPGHIVT
ncbi:hypothetical protein PENSTE_c019G06069 [Penicillium steckii]|uniref:Uncharacterized protein n=1 Tax=Penicillium steckii TaxID=303698 RepID=A0A1V6SVM4_9EURO|nr:hypothetical protein PENSTE_c019G06069 [Penicillium steckii]